MIYLRIEKKYINSMVTFMFGAGASIPFFNPRLDTNYLTSKIMDFGEWQRLFNRYTKLIESNRIVTNANDVYRLMCIITKVRKNANFEEIAEILDKICSWGFDRLPQNTFLGSIVAVLGNGSWPVPNVVDLGWSIVPVLLRQVIAESICELQNNHKISTYDELISLQTKFLIDASAEHDKSSIMSLNYDECVVNSAIPAGFDTCFCKDASMNGAVLDVHRFMSSKKTIYFPHGHTRFVYADNSNVLYFPDANKANDERWRRIESHMKGGQLQMLPGKFAYNFNTFLTTGQTKDDAMNNVPYCYFYHRFSIDVFASDIVFLIGYSFGDEHFNRTLPAFLQIDSKRRVVIVDYYPEAVTRRDEFQDPNNALTKIYSAFKRDWDFYTALDGKLEPTNQAEIDKINSLGYGYIFNQVLFYKKGYENFLNEYLAVLEYMNY